MIEEQASNPIGQVPNAHSASDGTRSASDDTRSAYGNSRSTHEDARSANENARSANENAQSTNQDARSAYEKAGADDIDPRCVPQSLKETPPIGVDIEYPVYSNEDNETWRILVNRQMDMLPGRAGEAFMNGVEMLGLRRDTIPALADLSRVLKQETDWRIARIPGLLHEKDFFDLLANRTFPSTDYIRGRDEIDYTPAPDLFHDIFGHMPMLTQPAFADFYQMFGRAALDAKGADRPRLERFHWFTVEFGLIRETSGIRIFGAGILSSKNEVSHALSDDVEKIDFDPERIVEQDYDVWHLQDLLFVLDSFEQLVEGFKSWTGKKGLLQTTEAR